MQPTLSQRKHPRASQAAALAPASRAAALPVSLPAPLVILVGVSLLLSILIILPR